MALRLFDSSALRQAQSSELRAQDKRNIIFYPERETVEGRNNIYTIRRSELLTLVKWLNETKISEVSKDVIKISTYPVKLSCVDNDKH